jgi:hypothetical protein
VAECPPRYVDLALPKQNDVANDFGPGNSKISPGNKRRRTMFLSGFPEQRHSRASGRHKIYQRSWYLNEKADNGRCNAN